MTTEAMPALLMMYLASLHGHAKFRAILMRDYREQTQTAWEYFSR